MKKNILKRIIATMLITATAISMTGCSFPGNILGKKEKTESKVKNEKLVDDEYVDLSIESMKVDADDCSYTYSCKTKKDGQSIILDMYVIAVNGVMVKDEERMPIGQVFDDWDGKKKTETVDFISVNDALSKLDENKITVVDFYYDYTVYEDSEIINEAEGTKSIYPYGEKEAHYYKPDENNGKVIFENDGVKVIFLGADFSDDGLNFNMNYYIENKGDIEQISFASATTFYDQKMYVNGEEYTTEMGSDGITFVDNGYCGLWSVSFDTLDSVFDDIESVDDIDTIEVGIALYDTDNFGKDNRDKFIFDDMFFLDSLR